MSARDRSQVSRKGRSAPLMSGFEVEWCNGVPADDLGEADFDNADYEYKDFANHADAVKFAREVLPRDYFGSVRVTPFALELLVADEPRAGRTREYTDDPEYIESETVKG